MGMLGSVVLILLGVLATSSDLKKHQPRLAFWVDNLIPFQGYLGIAAAFYGLFLTLKMVAYIGFILYAPFVYLASLAAGLDAMALGVLLGYRTAQKWVARRFSPAQLARGEELYQRLATLQLQLGYGGIWLGCFALLLNIFN